MVLAGLVRITSYNVCYTKLLRFDAVAGDGKVTLRWDALSAADLAGYFVYRDGVQLNAEPWTDTSYVDTAVSNGTSYDYTVRSYSRGDILGTEAPTVTVTPRAATAPPVDLRAELGCDGRVTISWLRPAASDVLGYNVYAQAGIRITSYNACYTKLLRWGNIVRRRKCLRWLSKGLMIYPLPSAM